MADYNGTMRSILLISLLLLFLVLCISIRVDGFVSSTVSLVQQSPPRIDPRKELETACGQELDDYDCRDEGMVWELYCLYGVRKDALGASCEQYLGSTTFGGCDEEAHTLCLDKTNTDTILACLEENKDKLSSDCLRNIQANAEKNSPMQQLEDMILVSTRRVTRLGVIFLAIPLFLAMYAYWWMTMVVDKKQREVLNELPSTWKEQSQLSMSADRNESSVLDQQGPWCLSFQDITYWVVEKKTWKEPFKVTKQRILCNVSLNEETLFDCCVHKLLQNMLRLDIWTNTSWKADCYYGSFGIRYGLNKQSTKCVDYTIS
jgi:hypothetical protein